MRFGDLIDRALVAGAGPRPALIDGSRTLDYDALDQAANRFARWLAARGYGPGTRVALQSRNSLAFAVAVLGAARAGIVLILLSTRATAEETAAAVAQTAPALLLTEPDLDRTLDGWLAGAAARPAVALDEDAPLALLFSGGTTGVAKAVLVGHRARLVTAAISAEGFGLTAADRLLVSTPLFHTAALFCWLAPAWQIGATVVLGGRWSAANFIDRVEAHRVTGAFLVPTQIADLLAEPGLDPRRLASLRLVCHAGAPMPPGLHARLAHLLPQVEIVEHYGLSETGLLTVRRGGDPATVGRAPAPVELAIRAPGGAFLAAGEIGEIATRGPHLLLGDQPAALFPWGDEWLATGDLGRLAADGTLTLAGRSRDIIISGAENLYPGEIEAALSRHPALAECAVFGVPDDRLGEVPVAQVVLRPGMTATEDELIALVLAILPRHKRPRRVIFAPSLPRSAVGKVQKAALAAAYRARGT